MALSLLAAACGSSASDQAADTVPASTTSESAPSVGGDPCAGGGLGPGTATEVFTSGGVDYAVQTFVPPAYDHSPLPLLLDFHGLGSDGAAQSSFSGYDALAAREGFVVVNPTGPPAADDFRNRWELAQFDLPDRDDVAMVAELIDRVGEQLCIDRGRVYAAGMSNGGFFSSLLACRLADRLAATFSVAGISHPDDCEPARSIPVAAIHGTADEVVPFDGGTSSLATDEQDAALYADFFSQSMPDEAAEFAADFGCSTVTDTRIGPETTRRVYSDCVDDVEVHFYEVDGGGHTWPGSPLATLVESSLGHATEDLDVTEVSWAFLSQYTLASP